MADQYDGYKEVFSHPGIAKALKEEEPEKYKAYLRRAIQDHGFAFTNSVVAQELATRNRPLYRQYRDEFYGVKPSNKES